MNERMEVRGVMKAFRVPLALVLLSLVPMVAGVARLVGVATDAVKPEDVRFAAAPHATFFHVISATLYAVLGSFQFSAEVLRRWPRWHRGAGRVLVVAGLVTALTGMWMAATWDIPATMQGAPILVTRLAVGAVMVLSLTLGVRAILRRDVAAHEAWMIRAWALGQGAGAQVLLLGVPAIFVGQLVGTPRDVLMVAAWVLNLVLAEVLIRRRAQPRTVPLVAAPPADAWA